MKVHKFGGIKKKEECKKLENYDIKFYSYDMIYGRQ
jgi:hypothetical protein